MVYTIDRLLFRELIVTLSMVLLVFSVVVIANNLVRILGQVAEGGLDQHLVLTLAGLELAKVIGFMIPPAFFLSLMMVLGRMHRDGEVVALEAVGVGPTRLFRAVSFTALPLTLLVTWLVMSVLPWAKAYTERVKVEATKTGDFTALRSGRFNEFRGGELVIFADRIDADGSLKRVFVQHRQHGKIGLVLAATARLDRDMYPGQSYIVLSDGKRYEGWPGKGDFSIGEFSQYGLRLVWEGQAALRRLPQSAKPWRVLIASEDIEDRAEFQYRLAFPLALLALVLVAIPLVLSLPRRAMYRRLALAILIYFILMNLLRLAQEWMGEGLTPPWMGVWWVPAMFALLAPLLLMIGSLRFRRLWRRQGRSTGC